MRYPTVADIGIYNAVGSLTSHTGCNYPTTVKAGQLLIYIAACDGTGDIPSMSGPIELYTASNGGLGTCIYYEKATGAEGGENFTVAVTTSEGLVAHCFAIEGWDGVTPPEIGTVATGNSTTPNPPSITPSWGSDDNLIIALAGANGSETFSVFPYADNNNSGVGAGSVGLATCTDELTASPEDPGTFTKSGTNGWAAHTIAIRAAATLNIPLGAITIRRPWTKQPPQGVGIDRNNPLARNMQFLWSGVTPFLDIARNISAASHTVTDLGPTSQGMAILGDGATQNQIIAFPSPLGHCSGISELTLGFVFRLKNLTDTTQRRMFSKDDSAGQGSWFFRKREDSGSGVLELFISRTAGDDSAAGTSSAFTDTDSFHVCIATFDGTTTNFYIDGVEEGTLTEAGSDTIEDESFDICIHGWDSGSQESSMDIPLCWAQHTTLSAEEVVKLSTNLEDVWQVFEPRTIRIADAPDQNLVVF